LRRGGRAGLRQAKRRGVRCDGRGCRDRCLPDRPRYARSEHRQTIAASQDPGAVFSASSGIRDHPQGALHQAFGHNQSLAPGGTQQTQNITATLQQYYNIAAILLQYSVFARNLQRHIQNIAAILRQYCNVTTIIIILLQIFCDV